MSVLHTLFRKAASPLLSMVSKAGDEKCGEPSVIEGDIKLTNDFSYDLSDGVCFGQGITTDGRYFYGFGALKFADFNCVVKIDAKTGKIVNLNEMCIPHDLMLKGYSHLGDGCCYKGKLYVACEDFGFRNPAIFVYDADTLQFVEYRVIPAECKGDRHVPWCTIKDDILYFTQFDNVNEIRMLDMNDGFRYIGSVRIDMKLFKVQGGDFYNGKLYLATDDGDKEKPAYEINIETGECRRCFLRGTGNLNTEAEGMTVCKFENGSLFHLIDVGTSVHIRSYEPTK